MTILPNGESWAFNYELEKLYKSGAYDDYKKQVPDGLIKQTPREFIEEYYKKNSRTDICLDYGDSVSLWIDKYGGYWDGNYNLGIFSATALHSYETPWDTLVCEMPWGDVYVANGGCGECETRLCHFSNINHYLQACYEVNNV